MIAWLLPAALSGLLLALGPLHIHLLRRRHSRRVVVPTLRFIPAVSQSSVRVRTPDDLLLLLLRTSAIVAAVLALAGPFFLTAARRSAWDARILRAVVVDTSASASAQTHAEVIASELGGGEDSRRIDSDALAEGLRQAAAWLAAAPPGRREVVVVSDFQHGSLSVTDISGLPAGVGLRFVRVAGRARSNRIDAGHELFEGRPGDRTISLDGWSTALAVSGPSNVTPDLKIEGASPNEAARLERVVRAGGVSWPRDAGSTVVRFGAADSVPPVGDATGSARQPVMRLLADPGVSGIPFLAAADGDSLVVSTSAAPASYEAAVLVQAAIDAWRAPGADAEAEAQSLPDATLHAWTRPPPPADPSAWRQVERGDARWFWLASVVCLTGEWWLRRRPTAEEAGHARAA